MSLSAADLISRLKENLAADRKVLVEFLKILDEVDRRRLYLGQGYPSLYAFLVKGLRISEGSSYRRIQVARSARRFPRILKMLEEGDIHLVGASILAPVLTQENAQRLLASAKHQSKRQIERLVSDLSIQMVRIPPDSIRTLPVPENLSSDDQRVHSPEQKAQRPAPSDQVVADRTFTGGGKIISNSNILQTSGAPTTNKTLFVQAKRRISIHFIADEDFLQALEQARALMRHKYPEGRLEDVFGEALRIYLERKDPQRPLPSRQLGRPSTSRSISAYVKAQVWKRDEGRCTFVSPDQKRCDAREGLEFDHKIPWSRGGLSTERNLRLLCRAHNQHAARLEFGEKWIERKIEESKKKMAQIRD